MTKETKDLITDVLYKYNYYCLANSTEETQYCHFLFNGIIFIIRKEWKHLSKAYLDLMI